MPLPRFIRRLFENEGAGPKLHKEIIPSHADTHGEKGSDPITPESIGAARASASGGASSADVAGKLKTPRAIDGVNFDGSAAIIHYATCSTAAGTAAKVVSLAGFTLVTGAKVTVRFTVTNTAANPTLNVGGTGAKAIQYRKAAITAGALAANRTYDFVYDGSSWELVGDLDSNTTYGAASTSKAGIVQLSSAVNSTSETQAATPKAVKTAYDKASSAATAAAAAQADADTAQSTATAAKSAAATAQTKANNAYTEATKAASTSAAGRVQLSDAVNSTASTTAATSKAAKTAYDKAVAATFPTGTKLLFHQAAAPTGWTKQTTVNDAALRVVSGTTGGGTGGSLAFSSLFAAGKAVTLSGNVGATTLTVSQSALHQHPTCQGKPFGSSEGFPTGENPSPNKKGLGGTWYGAEEVIYTWASADAGGSKSHTHTLAGSAKIALNVKYTDVIICAKA